eukprot:COSAG02_NODE_15404_length_1174_cov_0.894884_1_plen_104_part_10
MRLVTYAYLEWLIHCGSTEPATLSPVVIVPGLVVAYIQNGTCIISVIRSATVKTLSVEQNDRARLCTRHAKSKLLGVDTLFHSHFVTAQDELSGTVVCPRNIKG